MRTRLLSIAFVLALGACSPFPPATPDEAPAQECPCPDFALNHHPEDPDSPGECIARSRTGQIMHAEEHPACQREAMERMGWGP